MRSLPLADTHDGRNAAVELMKLTAPESSGEEEEPANVFCNVYDILPRVNSVCRCLGSEWGIYHTGVQVHSLEFAYGGHSDASTGVFCAKPRSAQGAVFHHQVPIGRIDLDSLELRQSVADISRLWPGNTYDPFKRNCNHFSDSLCQELTGSPAPTYINRFTQSCLVRGIFFRCVVPLGRCLERFYEHGGITYNEDTDVASGEVGDEATGISGARGINQVFVEAATAQKTKANKFFKESAFGQAREAYHKALGYLKSMSRRGQEEDDEVFEQAKKVRVALLLNLAACDLKTEEHERAVSTCSEALALDPASQKGRFRRGVALSHLGRLEESSADLRAVLQAAEAEGDAATVRDARRELARLRQLTEVEKQKDRDLARRMLGGSVPASVAPPAAHAPVSE